MAKVTRFAGYPSAVVYATPGGQARKGKTAVQHLLWGDWLRLEGKRQGRFEKVHARGVDGWMHEDDIQQERLLEIYFVDIGQGDGCLLITPDDEAFVIDAGVGDNMYRFLRWKYGRFAKPFTFEAGVISHPDADHYAGFEELFADPNVRFKALYHNGILERNSASKSASLGPRKKVGTRSFLKELVQSKAELSSFLSVASRWKRKKYPTMLAKGVANRSFGKFEMLAASDAHLPGFGPDAKVHMEVLGPVEEEGGLRWLGDVGKTKNGHSVVLRVHYGQTRFLLGGDLNIPSEELLLAHHTGLSARPRNEDDRFALVEAARSVFGVDVAKSCHHGSADFSSLFLDATHPIATVISSGDDEPHSHPRADALGSIGLHSRGTRPLIFSTELARSVKETVKHPNMIRIALLQLHEDILKAEKTLLANDTAANRKARDKLVKKRDELQDVVLNRSIAVYGAINVRSDGDRVVVAQKIERPSSKSRKWDIYRLEREGHNGPLQYQSKH